VSVSGHRVRVRVRLLDSAATAYGGPGHETGPARTVAGLDRARVTVVLRRHGTVAAQATVPGRDTGTAGDGDGMVGTGFSVRPGRYGVTVQESGPTYAAPAWAGTLRVR
jgi:hypothetical protein